MNEIYRKNFTLDSAAKHFNRSTTLISRWLAGCNAYPMNAGHRPLVYPAVAWYALENMDSITPRRNRAKKTDAPILEPQKIDRRISVSEIAEEYSNIVGDRLDNKIVRDLLGKKYKLIDETVYPHRITDKDKALELIAKHYPARGDGIDYEVIAKRTGKTPEEVREIFLSHLEDFSTSDYWQGATITGKQRRSKAMLFSKAGADQLAALINPTNSEQVEIYFSDQKTDKLIRVGFSLTPENLEFIQRCRGCLYGATNTTQLINAIIDRCRADNADVYARLKDLQDKAFS
jgi:mRNA-degrading endonuclease HigB of HigAB toxin-antitoxin module